MPRLKIDIEQIYCLKCRKQVEVDPDEVTLGYTKNNRPRVSATCPECGREINKFVKLDDVEN